VRPLSSARLSIGNVLGCLCWMWKPYLRVVFRKSRLVWVLFYIWEVCCLSTVLTCFRITNTFWWGWLSLGNVTAWPPVVQFQVGVMPLLHSLPNIPVFRLSPSILRCTSYSTECIDWFISTNKQIPWPDSASELYRPSDRRLLPRLMPTFADRGSHVVSVTNPQAVFSAL
jgi:hypothetical protein